MQKIAPCLWFDGNAEEAVRFYTSVFPDSSIGQVMRYGKAGPGPEGTVCSMEFQLAGQEFLALNGGPMYTFSPAISLFVPCETQEEVDAFWARFLEGGTPQRCGWITDRFGVSWQIVPTILGEMLRDTDAARAARVMQAMMQMVKLDAHVLRQAWERG